MKHKPIQIAVALALLAACQAAPQLTVTRQIQTQTSLAPAELVAQARIEKDAQGSRLRISLRSVQDGFSIKPATCPTINTMSISITGIGITTPITANASPTGTGTCEFTSGALGSIPVGKARIMTITATDAAAQTLAVVKAAFDVDPAGSSTVDISYRSHMAARVLEELMNQGSLGKVYATRLNLTALQTWIDGLIGLGGTFPNFTYASHPLLLKPTVLANAISAGNGVIPSAAPAGHLATPASLTLTVTNASAGPLNVNLRYPQSAQQTRSTPGASEVFTFANVIPGTWRLNVVNGPGANQSLTFAEGESKTHTVNLTATPTANWSRANGPFGGTVLNLAKDGANAFYVVTENGGLHRSTNNGEFWSDAADNLNTNQVVAVAANPANAAVGHVVVATANGQIFRRDYINNQASWSLLSTQPFGSFPAQLLYIDPDDPVRVFAVNSGGQIMECPDITVGFPAWNNVSTGLTGVTSVRRLAKDSANGRFFAATNNGFFTAPSAGVTWTASNSGIAGSLNFTSVHVSSSANAVYVSGSAGELYSSQLPTIAWTSISSGLATLPISDIVQSTAGNKYIFAGTSSGLKKSADIGPHDGVPDGGVFVTADQGGGTPFPPNAPQHPHLSQLLLDVGGNVLAGTKGAGVNRWSSLWESYNEGLRGAQVRAVLKLNLDGNRDALYAATSGGVQRSDNGGSTWSPMLNIGVNGLERKVSSLAYVDRGGGKYDIYAGTGAGVIRLDNIDDTSADSIGWSLVNSPMPDQDVRSLLLLSNHKLLAGTASGLYNICALNTSCTSVTSWTQLGGGTVNQAYSLAVKPGTDTHYYVGGTQNTYVSTNGGATWNARSMGITGQRVQALATLSSASGGAADDVVYAGLNAIGAFGTMYKSTDGGASFSSIGNPGAGIGINALLVKSGNVNEVYAGTTNGVYVSVDGGTTWTAFNNGSDSLTGVNVDSLYMEGTKLYAGTNGRSLYIHDTFLGA